MLWGGEGRCSDSFLAPLMVPCVPGGDIKRETGRVKKALLMEMSGPWRNTARYRNDPTFLNGALQRHGNHRGLQSGPSLGGSNDITVRRWVRAATADGTAAPDPPPPLLGGLSGQQPAGPPHIGAGMALISPTGRQMGPGWGAARPRGAQRGVRLGAERRSGGAEGLSVRSGGTAQPRNAALSSARARPRSARTFLRRDRRSVPAMLRPQPLCVLLLLLHGGRAASPNNGTETPRAAEGNGTRTGAGLLPASGLPVLRRAVFVVSALSALAALYFVLRTFR